MVNENGNLNGSDFLVKAHMFEGVVAAVLGNRDAGQVYIVRPYNEMTSSNKGFFVGYAPAESGIDQPYRHPEDSVRIALERVQLEGTFARLHYTIERIAYQHVSLEDGKSQPWFGGYKDALLTASASIVGLSPSVPHSNPEISDRSMYLHYVHKVTCLGNPIHQIDPSPELVNVVAALSAAKPVFTEMHKLIGTRLARENED